MSKDYILNETCFDDEDRKSYHKYNEIIGDSLNDVASRFMNKEIPFEEAVKLARKTCPDDISEYTSDLFFVLECAVLLEKKYEEKNFSGEMFTGFIKDIKCKIDECKKIKNVFGTFVIEWYKGFFQLTRFSLGRLQFDKARCDQDWCDKDSGVIGDFILNEGDFVLACHIPSSGPLKEEGVIESLKAAYDFFGDEIKGGIMPVVCSSWLLYPDYQDVFGEESNIAKFARNFKIRKVQHSDRFLDAWRVFGMDYDNNISELPSETSLQKKFIEYVKTKNQFGSGRGILLFDGNKVLTRE